MDIREEYIVDRMGPRYEKTVHLLAEKGQRKYTEDVLRNLHDKGFFISDILRWAQRMAAAHNCTAVVESTSVKMKEAAIYYAGRHPMAGHKHAEFETVLTYDIPCVMECLTSVDMARQAVRKQKKRKTE